VTVLTFDEQSTQISITQNCQETYKCKDFVPMVDKTMDIAWQKMVANDKFSLSKGTSPTFIVAYMLIFLGIYWLLSKS
jgi:hypothetical protein